MLRLNGIMRSEVETLGSTCFSSKPALDDWQCVLGIILALNFLHARTVTANLPHGHLPHHELRLVPPALRRCLPHQPSLAICRKDRPVIRLRPG